MMRTSAFLSVAVLFAVASLAAPDKTPAKPAAGIAWQDWSDSAFDQARREKRFVLLDLGAVWCHWCHVMEETTYRDPKVVDLVRARYVPLRVDQDSRPDLSNRYEDYGWPATVVFAADGTEIVKFSGYIPPPRMASLLQGVIDDPSPGPSAAVEGDYTWSQAPSLAPELRARLGERLLSRYDDEHKGWGFTKKFMDWDAVEYSMVLASRGDKDAERRARETLDAQLRLIDPVWGGVYQYSEGGDWKSPHFEKIMQFQAEDLRLFALAYRRWHDPAYLKAARDIHRYIEAFLESPEGAFYVSQDADLRPGEHSGTYYALGDAERRKLGIPRVDTHLYARETAWAANALVVLYAATDEAPVLDEARRAATWIVENRGLPGGGFHHDAKDPSGPYLGDSISAARAFLALYEATGERVWLERATAATDFIEKTFKREGVAGYVTTVSASRFEPSRPQRDENILVARFASRLVRLTAKPEHRRMAEQAMRFLATPEIATRPETGGVLLADLEVREAVPAP